MEGLSFSQKPDEKLFFLGALAGLGKIGAGKIASASLKRATTMKIKPTIPSVQKLNKISVSVGDINIDRRNKEDK
jgi:hypothetical protein